MISNQTIQESIDDVRAITRIDLCVLDINGSISIFLSANAAKNSIIPKKAPPNWLSKFLPIVFELSLQNSLILAPIGYNLCGNPLEYNTTVLFYRFFSLNAIRSLKSLQTIH